MAQSKAQEYRHHLQEAQNWMYESNNQGHQIAQQQVQYPYYGNWGGTNQVAIVNWTAQNSTANYCSAASLVGAGGGTGGLCG